MDLNTRTESEFHEAVNEYFGSSQKNVSNDPVRVLKNNQLSALESLATLLLREVELLKTSEERVTNRLDSEEGINLYEELQHFEASMIRSALIRARGVQRRAAELLGMKVTTLNVKIKRYKISFSPENEQE